MNEIKLKLSDNGRGGFYVEDSGEVLAEMAIGIADGRLVVYHTEVSEKLKGQNMGKKLIEEMTKYARDNNLMVVPLCPFVNAQFRRHEDLYKDIWLKDYR